MGATNYVTRAKGRTMDEAFRNAVNEAEHEHGHDPYNGTISTSQGYRDKTAYFKKSGVSIDKFIEDNEDGDGKWNSCWGVCLKEPKAQKVKAKVEHKIFKGTRKWELRYIVREAYEGNFIATCKTKTEALKKAKEYTERHLKSADISMEKQLFGSDPRVARVYTGPLSKDTIGEYVFFGLAAC